MKKTITGMIVFKVVSALVIIASACMLAANAMGAVKLNILQAVIAVAFLMKLRSIVLRLNSRGEYDESKRNYSWFIERNHDIYINRMFPE